MSERKQRILVELAGWIILAAVLIVATMQTSHGQQVYNTLWALNVQRAHLGLYPLLPDPQLQAAAEQAARVRAARGIRSHLRGRSPVAGRAEGVAARSSRQRGPAGRFWDHRDVYACYQSTTRYRYAGVASALGSDGRYYYQVNLR